MRRQRKIAGMDSAVTLPGCAGTKEEKINLSVTAATASTSPGRSMQTVCLIR